MKKLYLILAGENNATYYIEGISDRGRAEIWLSERGGFFKEDERYVQVSPSLLLRGHGGRFGAKQCWTCTIKELEEDAVKATGKTIFQDWEIHFDTTLRV